MYNFKVKELKIYLKTTIYSLYVFSYFHCLANEYFYSAELQSAFQEISDD